MTVPFSTLQGQVIKHVLVHKGGESRDKIIFITSKNIYEMSHDRDCCEYVCIDDITENFEDILVGERILVADESYSEPDVENLWTFYKLATIKGWVDIRWHGSDEGYYSKAVDLKSIA